MSYGGGSVIITVSLASQPRSSVTITIYSPAGKLKAVPVVCTGIVFQE